ncbi:uncharacterized protein LOC127137814 [Lathyrus oleraceus]|uniref:uncharacterized protein LOC127137814 n=1 Tax=Pisum sativum TaxID=3888 RepID=UPI0021D0B424|nr:uncharacterized protein LOC127137814 [Pisum sativum]
MEVDGTDITWVVLKTEFLEKYFPANVHSKKNIEFLELKQGNMIGAKWLKCIKFESGLLPEIKQFIGYQEILRFAVLVNKCMIYNEYSRAISAHYKSASKKNSGNQFCGKLYLTSDDKGKEKFQQKSAGGKEISCAGAHNPIKCFKWGELGHRANECKSAGLKCFKYGNTGHHIDECMSNVPTCDNCGEQDHINNLIQGTCFIQGVMLIDMIDIGENHSFISIECINKLKLQVSSMNQTLSASGENDPESIILMTPAKDVVIVDKGEEVDFEAPDATQLSGTKPSKKLKIEPSS